MKFIFVYPEARIYERVLSRYQTYQKALKQRKQYASNLIEGSIFLEQTAECNLACIDAAVIVIHVAVAVNAAQVIQHWRARDKIVVVDMSIPVVFLPERNAFQIGAPVSTSESVEPLQPLVVERDPFIWTIKLADGVITNSHRNYEDWTDSLRIQYIPDYLELDQYLIHPIEAHEGLRIGVKVVEGGIQKVSSTGLLSALEEICSGHSEIRVVVYGENPQFQHRLKLSAEQKRFIPRMNFKEWQDLLPSIDIGILPKMGEIDLHCGREDVLELMAMRIPWIASDGMCCHELRQFGWLVQNKRGAWERILNDMITNLENYRAENSEPYLFSLGQGIEENMDTWIAGCLAFHPDNWHGAAEKWVLEK